ncbi:MAG: SMC-Scp complex subunit ScpB [Coriobacteriia bacterium]|nr:SMC-Scp complex subunit ScpB [Coriobacteriia bacterium]MCL2537216.1 SMC-Scp complex subunit ScpB [Coriobacteriia bacterium]
MTTTNEETTQDDTLRGALEALLFVSDEPVSSGQLSKILDRDLVEVDEALRSLAESYTEENRGFQLREVAGGWRMYTHPAYAPVIEAYVLSWDTRKLSQAALEVLSVIAYKQPVTRAGINAVRGVSSESVVSSLIEKGLVRELGRDAHAGNAILYGTTTTFLTKFGLKSIDDLPPLEDFAPDEQTQASIKRRLGVTDDLPEIDGIDVDTMSAEDLAQEAEYVHSPHIPDEADDDINLVD